MRNPTDIPIRLIRRAPRPRLAGGAGAFAYSGFRWFSLAQFIGFTMLNIQMMTRGWAMQELTGSPFMVSLVGAVQVLPMLAFSFLGGELADRFSRKKILILGEVGALIGFASLAIPAAMNVLQPWHIIASTLWMGVAMALQNPARQAMIVDLVGEREQRRALGAYMVVIHLTILVGPIIGGPLLTTLGTEGALGLSTLAFVVVIPLYLPMKLAAVQVRSQPKGPLVSNLSAGVRYICKDPTLRWMFLALFVMVLFVNTWGGLFPTIAEDVLHRGAGGLGGINIAVGIGALTGAVLAAILAGRAHDARQQIVGSLLFAGFVIVLALSTSYPISLIATGLAAASGAPFFINNMTVTQLNAKDEFRGRVVSVRFVVSAVQPIGLMVLGAVAEITGPKAALAGSAAIGAFLMLVIAATYARSALMTGRVASRGPNSVAS